MWRVFLGQIPKGRPMQVIVPPWFRCLAGALYLFLGPLTGAAAAQDARERPAERPSDTWQFLRDAAAAEGATPDGFITYSGTAGQTHRIEIFRPQTGAATSAGPWPAIVLFHGGAWREGAPVQFYRQARVVADAGFIVALPEYSLSEEDGTTPRDSVVDAFLAWSMVRSVAGELGINPDRLFAGGASAGGQMAAALVTLAPPPDITDHMAPAGLILFNPVIDNGPDGYGYALVQDYWLSFSPLHNIGESHPPTLFLIGDSDPLIPVATAEEYCRRVRATGSDCSLEVFANAGHAWFNRDAFGYSKTLADMLAVLQIWSRHGN